MKEPRKMLGDIYQPEIQALMKLIESQSKETISNWCIGFAEKNYLPMFERLQPFDERPRQAIQAARDWMSKRIKLPEAKTFILACHEAARENDCDPIIQALARAIGQGASVIHTVTHALGIAFYGAAAIAYSQIGIRAPAEEHDKIAAQEFIKIYDSLKTVSIENEPNPAKVNWNC